MLSRSALLFSPPRDDMKGNMTIPARLMVPRAAFALFAADKPRCRAMPPTRYYLKAMRDAAVLQRAQRRSAQRRRHASLMPLLPLLLGCRAIISPLAAAFAELMLPRPRHAFSPSAMPRSAPFFSKHHVFERCSSPAQTIIFTMPYYTIRQRPRYPTRCRVCRDHSPRHDPAPRAKTF